MPNRKAKRKHKSHTQEAIKKFPSSLEKAMIRTANSYKPQLVKEPPDLVSLVEETMRWKCSAEIHVGAVLCHFRHRYTNYESLLNYFNRQKGIFARGYFFEESTEHIFLVPRGKIKSLFFETYPNARSQFDVCKAIARQRLQENPLPSFKDYSASSVRI